MAGLPVFRGMMPILPTPVSADGELDGPSLRRLVQYALKCGAVAIGHLGGASEYQKVADDQRVRITEVVVAEAAGRVPVFIGVAAPAIRTALQYARQAERIGADLLMAGVPWVEVPDSRGVFDYYRALSDAVSLPIIVQDTSLSDAVLTPDFMLRLATEVEHCRYAKLEGSRFLNKIAAVQEAVGERMQVIGGAGGKHLIHMLRLGVTAYMTGTEALDIHGAVVRAYLEGDEDEAARIYYERLLPYLMFYMEYNRELLKGMLHRRGVMDCPAVIPPGRSSVMSEIERREFEWVLARIGFDRQHWPDLG